MIWKFNLNKSDSTKMFPGESFWHKILHMWHDYAYREPQNGTMIRNQIVCYNSLVRSGEQPITFDAMIKNKVCYMKDLVDISGKFYNVKDLNKNGFKVTWYEHLTITESIPHFWKFAVRTPNLLDFEIDKYELLKSRDKASRAIYKNMIGNTKNLLKCAKTWSSKLGIYINEKEMSTYFKNIYRITNVSKYRDFQYRLLNNRIHCNDRLVYWKICESNICNVCQKDKQTILHLLCECEEVVNIWKYVMGLCEKMSNIKLNFNQESIVFNKVHEKTTHICNFIILIVKQYLYRCKCINTKPTNEIIEEIQYIEKIEFYNALENNRVKKHIKKWSPFLKIYESCTDIM